MKRVHSEIESFQSQAEITQQYQAMKKIL
jgi:hypothetical protein